MDRSRSKRSYYDQDYDSDNLSRTKPRYNPHNYHHAPQSNHHRRFVTSGAGNIGGGRKVQDPSFMVTTSYRILCHDVKVGGVIGKSGSIIKSIRQHTGAWINVHELVQGDEERIIEISDTRRRDPDGRMPAFSPAQEALLLVHLRILESDAEFGGEDGDEYGGRGGGGGGANRVVTRLVVSRIHVGSLLGKGGKIIEQMRNETKTHIRVLPRDNNLPRCVAMSEEIVQVTGEMNNVKNALGIISSRLRESQHRDRNHFHGRLHSPEHVFPPSDDFNPPVNDLGRRASVDGSRLSRSFNTSRGYSSNSSRPSGYAIESGGPPFTDNNEQLITSEILVFRIICPVYKVNAIIGESDGIIDLLQNDIGVHVEITDPVAGFNEQIIIISSDEGPDDELFPAQEALLHIQTAIVDLVSEKENVVTTRLVVQSDEVGCLRGVSELQKLNGAVVQILPKEELSSCLSETDVIVQIVGEIRAAREALIEVTTRLRSYTYRELFVKETSPISPPSPVGSVSGTETASANNYSSLSQETHPAASALQNGSGIQIPHPLKDVGVPVVETSNQNFSERLKDMPSALNRIHVPLVTRSTLEVVIPPHAAPKLITKSRNKLAQISELSGATVKLIEDRPEETEKIIQISGTPDQAERAQSLLQGFILSTQEDGP